MRRAVFVLAFFAIGCSAHDEIVYKVATNRQAPEVPYGDTAWVEPPVWVTKEHVKNVSYESDAPALKGRDYDRVRAMSPKLPPPASNRKY